jgi:hypothetical protein
LKPAFSGKYCQPMTYIPWKKFLKGIQIRFTVCLANRY